MPAIQHRQVTLSAIFTTDTCWRSKDEDRQYGRMPVLLVLHCQSAAPHYAPLLSALDRAGAQRVLRSAWVIHDSSTPDAVVDLLRVYLPTNDGYVVTEMGGTEWRPASEQRFARR